MVETYRCLRVPTGDLLVAPPVRCLRYDGRVPSKPPGSIWRTDDGLSVVASLEGEVGLTPLLCISVRRVGRDPDWDELLAVKEAFYGHQDAMLLSPEMLGVPGVWSFQQNVVVA